MNRFGFHFGLGATAGAAGVSFSGGSFSAEDTGTLATLSAPTGYSWPAASQQAELTAGGYDAVTMAIAGTSGTAGALTEVDDLSAAYVALLVGETTSARMKVSLVRNSDSATVEATVRLTILGATEVATAFNSSTWGTGVIPADAALPATAAGRTIDYTTTAPMTNTARASDEYTLAAPSAGGTIGRVFGADGAEIMRVYFEPGILWCDIQGTTYSLDVTSFADAAYLRACAAVTADRSTLIVAVEDAAGTQVTDTFALTGYTGPTVGKVSLFDSMERVQEDPISAAGVAFRGVFRVEADGTVSTVSAAGGFGFNFLKTSVSTEAAVLALLDDLPAASNAPAYSGNLATAAGSLILGSAASFGITTEFSGGLSPYTHPIPALPSGLVDDGDGTASGTPDEVGAATLTASRIDARGVTAQGSASVSVSAVALSLSDISDALGAVSAGQAKTLDLRTITYGGVAPYTYTVSRGSLAGNGYDWNWTPSTSGPLSVTITVTDDVDTEASATDTVTVQAAGVPAGYTAIATPEELIAAVNADPGGSFYITNDLDFGAYGDWGTAIDALDGGIIDGGGHVGTGFAISNAGGFKRGLVRNLRNGAIIRNFGLVGVDLTVGRYSGPFAGEMAIGARIENCYATGTLNANRAESGGIAGYMSESCAIVDSWTNVTVTQTGSESKFVGGIVGRSTSSSINRCLVLGPVTSTSSGSSGAPGPFAGASYSGVNNYFDSETTGFASDPHGSATARTTAAMKSGNAADFTGWSTDDWQFVAGHYPVLSWQDAPSAVVAAPTVSANIADLDLNYGDSDTWFFFDFFAGEDLQFEILDNPGWVTTSGYTAPSADSSGTFTVRAYNDGGEATQEVAYTVEAALTAVTTQTIYGSDALTLNSANSSTPVLSYFNFMDMPDQTDWIIPIWWYRRTGESANRELLRIEVPGETKHLIISGRQARWRNGGFAENGTLADEPVEGQWNLTMVHIGRAGSFTGVRVSVNGGPNRQSFVSLSGIRFLPTRLQISASIAEVAFLEGPYDVSNYALFWNGGVPQHLDQVDLTGTDLTMLGQIKLYRAAGATEVVDWADTDYPEFDADTGENVFWWDIPTPVEAYAVGGSRAWTEPAQPILPQAQSFQEISPFTETLYPGVPFRLRAMHGFTNATNLHYDGTDLTAEQDGDDLILTAAETTSSTVTDTIHASSSLGTTGPKSFRWRCIAASTLALSGTARPTVRLEVGQGMAPTDYWRHVTGGARPYTFTKISGPDWLRVKSWGADKGKATTAGTFPTVVRCTDAAGATADIEFDIVVVAAWDRSDEYVVPGGTTDIGPIIAAQAAAGKTITIPAGMGPLAWSDVSVPAIPLDGPPCIIRGANKDTSKLQRIRAGFASGGPLQNFLIENLTVDHASNSGWIGAIGKGNTLRNVHFQGTSVTIDLNDGQIWYNNSITYQFQQPGIAGNVGEDLVLQDVTFHGQKETCKLDKVNRFALYDVTAKASSMDTFKFQNAWCVVLDHVRYDSPEGNASKTQEEHRDMCQITNYSPPGSSINYPLGNFWFEDVILNVSNNDVETQGVFREQPGTKDYPPRGYVDGDAQGDDSFPNMSLERVFIASNSANHGFTTAWYSDWLLEGSVVVRHPATNAEKTLLFDNEPSQGVVQDSIFHLREPRLNNHNSTVSPAAFTAATPIINSVEVSTSPDWTYTDIFPNWANASLSYDMPIDAVADGQPASAARFWIDPDGAFNTANPNVGPSWLRDGIW